MPICTSCSAPVDSLWTEYSSPTNIRLTVCGGCKRFADPYVEEPLLVLALDLLLLRPGVYRHELYNRGVPPLKAGVGNGSGGEQQISNPPISRDEILTDLLLRLNAVTVAIDAYLLWSEAPISERSSAWLLLFACALELAVFQAGVTLACAAVLAGRRRWAAARSALPLEADFRFTLVPLTIVLSSLPKTLLLLLLSLFPQSGSPSSPSTDSPLLLGLPIPSSLLDAYLPSLMPSLGLLDRPWILRHLLSGLSNGFALKVLLAPLGIGAGASTACILVGYLARTAVLPLLGVRPTPGGR